MSGTDYLTREPIQVGELLGAVGSEGYGGTTVFVGSVRRSDEDGPVLSIEYTAYEEMVAAEADEILAEARERWPDGRFAVQHRIGEVPVGEASIAVVVATPHRAESFEACRYVIEEIKVRLPVWKKERFEDGSEAWRENEPGDRAD